MDRRPAEQREPEQQGPGRTGQLQQVRELERLELVRQTDRLRRGRELVQRGLAHRRDQRRAVLQQEHHRRPDEQRADVADLVDPEEQGPEQPGRL